MTLDLSAVQAGVDSDEVARCYGDRARRLRIVCRGFAGQPEIISRRIDNDPLRIEIRHDDRQVLHCREPAELIELW